jgi:hypothetical protein
MPEPLRSGSLARAEGEMEAEAGDQSAVHGWYRTKRRVVLAELRRLREVEGLLQAEIGRLRALLLAVWRGDASEEQQEEVTRISVEAALAAAEEAGKS